VFFDNHYQLAYVTSDLDEGIRILQAQFGLPEFKRLGRGAFENRVWTPAGERDIAMKGAIAVTGRLTVEVLQPVSGAVDIYTEMLTPDQPLRLHHIAMRCSDIDKAKAENERLGRPVVMDGTLGPARFIYVDARDTLGHFLEYVMAPAEYWAERDKLVGAAQ
jgi:hypothetical protein